MMGERDAAVPPDESRMLIDAFCNVQTDDGDAADGNGVATAAAAEVGKGAPGRGSFWRDVLEHEGGHCVPQRAADVAAIR